MDITALQALATTFSGLQLAVVVGFFFELRSLAASYRDLKTRNDAQDVHISTINTRLANVMGRMKIPLNEE